MTVIFLTAELSESATGYCAMAVAENLAQRGHMVHVVSANRKELDSVKCDGNLLLHEVPGNFIRRYIYDCQKSRRSITKLLGRLLLIIQRVFIQLKGVFTLIPLFDDVNILYRKASSIIENNNIDVVIPVVNPRESIRVAYLLFRKYHIPYIPYYLDSIYGNIGLKILPYNIYKKKALQYEDKCVSAAKSIVMMKSVKESYGEIDYNQHPYVTKVVFLDLPLLIPREVNGICLAKRLFEGQFVILFVGTMPNRVRDPRYVFQLANMVARDDVHFYFAGKSDYQNELNNLINRNNNIHFLGSIEHEHIDDYIQNADVLLNIGNSTPGMLPSKVFEYMSYQKPILSTVKEVLDKSISYLRIYGASMILDETKPLSENVSKTNHFIEKVKSGWVQIDIAGLVEKNAPLFTNTPMCFSEYIESFMS